MHPGRSVGYPALSLQIWAPLLNLTTDSSTDLSDRLVGTFLIKLPHMITGDISKTFQHLFDENKHRVNKKLLSIFSGISSFLVSPIANLNLHALPSYTIYYCSFCSPVFRFTMCERNNGSQPATYSFCKRLCCRALPILRKRP